MIGESYLGGWIVGIIVVIAKTQSIDGMFNRYERRLKLNNMNKPIIRWYAPWEFEGFSWFYHHWSYSDETSSLVSHGWRVCGLEVEWNWREYCQAHGMEE